MKIYSTRKKLKARKFSVRCESHLVKAVIEGKQNQCLQLEEVREGSMDVDCMLGKLIHNLDQFSTNQQINKFNAEKYLT